MKLQYRLHLIVLDDEEDDAFSLKKSLYGVVYPIYGSYLLHFIVEPMKNNFITIKGYKRANISNLTTFSL